MKTQTATVLAAFLAFAPAGLAQRRSGPQNDRPAANNDRPAANNSQPSAQSERPPVRPEPPRRPPTVNLPSSPILPMTNPVAPMTNPIQPVIRYGGNGTPTVVITDRNAPDRSRDQRRGNVPVVIVGGPYVGPYVPYVSTDYLYYPYVAPAPVPGQLPGTYRDTEPASVLYTAAPASAAVPVAPVEEESIYYPEPNIIITPPEPDRILQPPALGTTRVDVLARYGQPWGSIWARGKETLYFTGGLTLVLEDGKVTQIR
jgi:hypothetical protein